MFELLPDTWRFQEEDSKCCHQRRGNRRGPVNNILLWVECYSSLVAILAMNFPQKSSHFMAYLRTIVKAHRTFTGDGWVVYDTCFRRQAAASKSLDWGEIDFTLYNETFTGRAKVMSRCAHCSSDLHVSSDCAFAPTPTSAGATQPWTRPTSRTQPQATVCQLFNGRTGNRCAFNPCKYTHICSDCRGRHPVSTCRRGTRPPLEKSPRLESPHYGPKK